MESDWLIEAIYNNAAWCHAIATSHGLPATLTEPAWFCQHPTPPLYPNIVTLQRGISVDQIIDVIDPGLPSGWAIKDSFSELDLKEEVFTLAFEAQWYCRKPDQNIIRKKRDSLRLDAVNNQSELNRWISAWGKGQGIFNLTLLENDAVELFYLERDGQVVTGLATNRSGEYVGISNAFGHPDDISDCVTLLAMQYPSAGIVGYGDSTELDALSATGFRQIGDLRVWLRR